MNPYSSYKNSDVEWIGWIPDHWFVGSMKYLLSENNGGVWGGDPDNLDSDVVVIRSTEITIDGKWNLENPVKRQLSDRDHEKCKLQKDDIVITKSSGSPDHIGKSVIVTQEVEDIDCCYSNFVQRIRFERENSVLYHYILNSYVVRDQYRYLTHSTTGLGNLSGSTINNVQLPFIPLQEQQQISNYLDHKTQQIDSLIEKTQQKIELLKEQRTSLINQVVTKGLDSNVEMKDSGIEWIGEISSEWRVGKLGYFGSISRGSGYQYLEEVDENYQGRSEKVIRISDFREFQPMSCEYHEVFENCRVEKNNILIGGTGHYFGNCMFVNQCMKGLIHSYNILRLVIFEQDPKFFLFQLSSNRIRRQMDLSVLGSGQPFIDIQGLKSLVFLVPPLSEQKQIVDHLDKETTKIDSTIEKETQRIDLLKEYRQSLISNVVTGKVDVRDEVLV